MTQFPNPNDPPTQAAYGPPPDPYAAPQQPQYPPPPQYGQQPQYPPQQPSAPPYGPPQSAPPQYGPPQSAAPQYGPPQPQYGQPAYGYPGYAQPVTKSKLPLILGIIGGVLVLAMIIGVGVALASSGGKTPAAKGTTTPPTQAVNTDGATGGPTDATGGGGPATTPPAGNGGAHDLAIGAGVTVTDSDGTMTVTVNSVKYRTTGCDTGDFNISDPQPGDAYIVIEATYDVTKGKGSYNPFDWSVVDADGNESRDLGIFADCKPELNSGNSLTGKRHGLVVVEVKKGVQHGQIVYAPGFGEDNATWKF